MRNNYYRNAFEFWKNHANRCYFNVEKLWNIRNFRIGEGFQARTDYPPKFDSLPTVVIHSLSNILDYDLWK